MITVRRSQHGFALLLTLVLLMIGAIALSHVVRQSTGEALHALEAREELQRRWAVTSCRETLLPRAEGLLAKDARGPVDEDGVPIAGANQTPPGTDLRVSCELAGLEYDIVLTDEQAKYNPTVYGGLIFDEKPFLNKRTLRRVVQELAGDQGNSSDGKEGFVILRPLVGVDAEGQPIDEDEQGEHTHDVYTSYGQLFDGVSARTLLGETYRPGAASNLTCWGNGQLNLRRAPNAVVRRALSPVLGHEGVAQLLDARRNNPGLGPDAWLKDVADTAPDHKALAGSLVTDSSQAQGLWVVAYGRSRSWYTFTVRAQLPPEEEHEQTTALSGISAQDNDTFPELIERVRRYDYAW